MPSITIDYSLENEYPVDPQGFTDYVVFGLLCASTLVLCVTCYALAVLRSRYEPLKFKNLDKLYWMVLFGMIHSWSVFVNNEHLEIFVPVSVTSCVLWG
jgi:hypothetical protein